MNLNCSNLHLLFTKSINVQSKGESKNYTSIIIIQKYIKSKFSQKSFCVSKQKASINNNDSK